MKDEEEKEEKKTRVQRERKKENSKRGQGEHVRADALLCQNKAEKREIAGARVIVSQRGVKSREQTYRSMISLS